MTDPTFGVVVQRGESDGRPVVSADLSIIGLVGPAPDADVLAFPVNTPVLVFSNDTVLVPKLGASGFLQDAVKGINDQLAPLQRAATIVVVRTAAGVNADPTIANQLTIANIIGDSGLRTGLYAFLLAADEVGVTPRLIIAPGYTGLMANGIDSLTASTPGVGYVPGSVHTLTFSGGGSNAVQATGHAVADENGAIGTENLVLDTPGAWYTGAPAIAVGGAAPSGPGAAPLVVSASTDLLANPVCAALTPVLNQLLAHAIVESAGSSVANTRDWRETLNSQRLIPVDGGVKVTDETGATVIRPLAPRVAGLAVAVDYEKGAPFHSWANRPVQGIIGPAHSLSFSITDGSNEGQLLLSENIGIMVRGEQGSDFAISSGGFIFIGTDNAGDDEEWRFYNVTRGRDYINLMALRIFKSYLGRTNITGQTVQSILNQVGFMLRDLQAFGHILGYRTNFQGNQNSVEEIRAGHLHVLFRAEEPPVLRKITATSSRYREAIVALVTSLEAQLNLAA